MSAIEIKNVSGKDIEYHLVSEGLIIGRLHKGRGSKYPWRAYRREHYSFGGYKDVLLGSWDVEEGGKAAALRALGYVKQ